MADTYVAKANVVKVSIGPADGNRVARIIRAGGAIPEGVEQTSLDALVKRGLIERVKHAAAPAGAEADAAAKAAADAEAAAKAAADKKPAGK
ncbi:MAG: hypothetical protein Q4P23_03400 [Micrococcaceae bacterium]|nr:hypothetical protein [Micrococcaceae bacterium]